MGVVSRENRSKSTTRYFDVQMGCVRCVRGQTQMGVYSSAASSSLSSSSLASPSSSSPSLAAFLLP